MTNESTEFVIRWAGKTLGFKLSRNEAILYRDNNAIIIGLNGHPSRLIATHAFNPTSLSPGLRLELINLNSVIIAGAGADEKPFHPVPAWLTELYRLEILALSDVELSNIAVFGNLPLKYLDLRKVQYNDKSSVLKTIGSLRHLEIFVHDASFSAQDLAIIKERLPEVRFASKGSE